MSDSAPSPSSSSNNDTSSESPSPPDSDSKSSSPPPPSSSNSESKPPPPPPPSSDGSGSSPPSPPPPPPPKSPPPTTYPPPPLTSPPPPSTPPPPQSTSPPPPPPPSSNMAPPPSSSSGSPASPPPPPKANQQSPPPPDSPLSEASPPPPAARQPPNEFPATPAIPSPELAPETPADSYQPPPSSSDATTPIIPTKPSPSTHSDTTPSDHASRITPPSRHAESSSSTPSSKGSSDSSNSNVNGVAVGLAVAGVTVVLVAIIIMFTRKKRKRVDVLETHYMPPNNYSGISDGYYDRQANPIASSSHSDSFYASKPPIPIASGNMNGSQRGHGYSGPIEPSGSKSWFTYEELMDITNGFSQENLLGEGGFGCVYKGWLPDGRAVAVKQLKAGSGQGEREFKAEVEIISRVHHRHLVSLVGYCIAEHHRLLVYEFLPNDTVEHHLHGKGLPLLDWAKRLKIASGSARGLAYLHEDCHPRIIHRDIKSANILLDDSFEAQVADFGLAKLSNDTHTHVSTRVMGTFGYMAPEYASSGKLTDRSDVFSFGVVLLELITGRKPVDPSQPLGDESLVEWARPLLARALETGNYDGLVDPRLENNYVRSEMFRMVEAAAACVRHSAPKRPRMVQVVRALDCDSDMMDMSNGVKFGQSTVFDSSQYSADIEKFRRMAFGSSEFSSDYGYSGEHERRSSVNSGEFRSREAPPRPPNQCHELGSHAMSRTVSSESQGGEVPLRPPPYQCQPGEHNSGRYRTDCESETQALYRRGSVEFQSREPPYRPPNQWRPGGHSSGEYQSSHESETRAMNRGSSNRSSRGSYRHDGRGFP